MSRARRIATGGLAFHVLNRAVGRRTMFETGGDYAAFVNVVAEALRVRPMRICSYCVMPNHWHMVLWPVHDGDLSAFIQQVTNLHVKRWQRVHGEIGNGHLYQGRFKSFPIETDEYFQTVVRYVERNPLRANLVRRAENWPWSSLGQPFPDHPIRLAGWPVPRAAGRRSQAWLDWVNRPVSDQELQSLRTCVARGRPYGSEAWVARVAEQLDLGATLRSRGRPTVEHRVPWVQ